MCGLAGFWEGGCGWSAERLQATALEMADTLQQRGPDDRGAWSDPAAGIALGFRRLAIVDLSPEGHQPMCSASGRYVIVFNGEIYNFPDLRRELEAAPGVVFRGHSDTEVMLAAFDRWGVERSLERLLGMFAFAVWDRHERRLHLARDRMGEKPLYYGWSRGALLFGSQLQALKAHPGFEGALDRRALALYLRHGYIPAPYSIYEGIRKLSPGCFVTFSEQDAGREIQPVAYWSTRAVAEANQAHPFEGDDAEAVTRLDELLRDAVRRQMVADVPLGAFLSGGVDSSTVVALMQAQSPIPVRTFTIGFGVKDFDEAPYARAVARHLGTDHTELYVTPGEARDVVPKLPDLFDEPFADSSAVPTYLVSRLARRHVTVSLSGDGGDELFGGYPWYARGARLWRRLAKVPGVMRRVGAQGLHGLSGSRLLGAARLALPGRLRRYASAERLRKIATLAHHASSPERMHRVLVSQWDAADDVLADDVPESATAFDEPASWAMVPGVMNRLMSLDQVTYLPDDILVKVDRASMGVSLESRAPFLDPRVVAFAWTIPVGLKIRNGRGKWLTRQVLYRYVPPALIERPKMGFTAPLGAWLRGDLRDWAAELLDERRLRAEGLFNPAVIAQRWREHGKGIRDWSESLWIILMFQAWSASNR
jgi:asparagine synthase (glutamine-hydrolysing)